MATVRKVVGEAVAVKRGHYPTPDGAYTVLRMPGDKFPLLEGLEKGSWFQPAAKPMPKPDAPPVRERRPKKPPGPDGDDSIT